MTYKTGEWGEQAKLRSNRRKEYFREYRRKHPSKYIYIPIYKDKSKQISPKRREYVSQGTSLGYKGELLAQKLLKGSERINRPCDLKWEGKLVDVKTGIKHKISNKHVNGKRVDGKTYRWKFLLSKQKGKIDLFFIICKDLENKVQYIFLIPDKDIKNKYLNISENKVNKYSKYLLTLI